MVGSVLTVGSLVCISGLLALNLIRFDFSTRPRSKPNFVLLQND